jgi:glutaredoxin
MRAIKIISSWWTRLWSGTTTPSQPLQVTLYTRQGCHLCTDAEGHLRAAQGRYGFKLHIEDIDQRPELAALYGEEVPVIMVDGRVRFRGIVNRVLLNRLLRAEAKGHSRIAPTDP